MLEQQSRAHKSTLCLHPCVMDSDCSSQKGRNMISLPSFSELFELPAVQTLYFPQAPPEAQQVPIVLQTSEQGGCIFVLRSFPGRADGYKGVQHCTPSFHPTG